MRKNTQNQQFRIILISYTRSFRDRISKNMNPNSPEQSELNQIRDKSLSVRSRVLKGRVHTWRSEYNSIPELLHLCESFLNAAASAICSRHQEILCHISTYFPSLPLTTTQLTSICSLADLLLEPHLSTLHRSTFSKESLTKLNNVYKTMQIKKHGNYRIHRWVHCLSITSLVLNRIRNNKFENSWSNGFVSG